MNSRVKQIPPSKPPATNRKRVCAYACLTVDEGDASQLRSEQIRHYSRLIESNREWECVGIYVDTVIKENDAASNEFERMLDDCRMGKINMVITKSMLGFRRDIISLIYTVKGLTEYGVDIFFENENIHSMSEDGECMLSILSSYAEKESDV